MRRNSRFMLSSVATILFAGSLGVAFAQGTHHNPVRHHSVRMSGLPTPYQAVRNPFSGNPTILAEGATLYAENCASCHGDTGMGDGEAGGELKPPPPMLRMPTPQMMQGMGNMNCGRANQGMNRGNCGRQGMGMGMGRMGMGGMGMGRMGMGGMRMQRMMQMFKSDSFLMWTVSEGGTVLGTDMPVFKDSLSEVERWKVISYIQADLPKLN